MRKSGRCIRRRRTWRRSRIGRAAAERKGFEQLVYRRSRRGGKKDQENKSVEVAE